jgi:hypothetical protein
VDLLAIVQRLKLTPYPHCRVIGMLIWHGALQGIGETIYPKFPKFIRYG